MENSSSIIFSKDDIVIENHEHVSSTTGKVSYQQVLLDDSDTGMTIKMLRYPKGCLVPLHTHDCAHGFYVLKGTLTTSEGNYGPGSFVWFKEGSTMYHGAADEDMDALFITNKAFNIHYL